MAPKHSKTIKSGEITKPLTKAQKAKQEAEEAKALKEMADQKRGAQALMVTSLKKKTDAYSKAFMEQYNSLGRFDQQKDALLASWQQDKSLKTWYNNYKEVKTKKEEVNQEGAIGYGTQCPPVVVVVVCLKHHPKI